MRPKLAVIGHRGFPGVQGGVEKHCEALMPLLAKDIDIVAYRRKPYLTAESSQRIDNITYIDLPSTRIKGVEALLHTLICCLHIIVHRPNVVNIHNIGPGLFAPLLKLFNMKVVLTYHSPNYEHAKWNKAAKFLLRVSESVALRFSDHIIFVNKFQLQKYSDKIQKKSTYIPNGIPNISRSVNTDFLEKHNLKPRSYILAVGRLTPEKGFDILIQAINAIEAPVSLVIAGASDHDPHYLDSLKELDDKHRVTFTGYTSGEDLRQLYSHAQLFVLSSINEGFPLVLLEAMSYNLPMVVTDIPATHLVSLDSYQYIEPNSVTALKDGISVALRQNHTAEHYDLSTFNWDNIGQNTGIIYGKLLKAI